MPRIIIDENRKQIESFSNYAGINVEGAIRVDISSPAEYYKLKLDYMDFEGEEQWEINADAKQDYDDNVVLDEAFAIELNNTIWTEVEKNKKGNLNQRQIDKAKKKIK